MGKLLVIVVLLLAAVGAVFVSDRPLPRSELVVLHVVDFNTLDPQRMSYNQDLRLCYAIYEGLVRWDNDTFEIEPCIARDWEVSRDSLTYTFHLTGDARWSNGDRVTAHDFVYSWRRAILPETSADYSSMYFHIRGAREFFEWRNEQLDAYARKPEAERSRAAAERLWQRTVERFEQTVGIDAPDDRTLVVELDHPTPYFLDLCAFGPFSPVHPATVESFVSFDAATGALEQRHGWTKPGAIVTNGPYTPTVWRFKREMLLEPNPHYWQPERIRSETVTILPIEDANTGVLAFETGTVDWHTDVTVDYVADMLEQKRRGERDDIHALTAFGTYFWSFNCEERFADGRENPFRDARVRRALAMAVDKVEIVERVKRSGEKVADVLVPPGSIPGFESPGGLSYDPERAAALMIEAGWVDRDGDGVPENADGDEFPEIEMLCTQTQYHSAVALAMGRMWEELFGIRTKVVVRETKVYRDNLKRRDYMMARGGWFGDYGDPTTFLTLHKTGDGNNDRGYSNPKYDALLEAAREERDPEKRMDLLEEAERLTMQEELPVLPLWHYNYYYLFKPPVDAQGNPNPGGLKGISDHPRLVQYLWELEVVE